MAKKKPKLESQDPAEEDPQLEETPESFELPMKNRGPQNPVEPEKPGNGNRSKNDRDQSTGLSQDEMVILAITAALNDFRHKNATRDSRVNELMSDVRKEKGAREVAQQKNAHLTIRSVNEELADLENIKHSTRVPSSGGGKFVGAFIVGFLSCYFFLLMAGILH